MTASTRGAGPGRLYVLPYSPEAAGTGLAGGTSPWAEARLVVAGPGVPAAGIQHAPLETPVVCLPSVGAGPVETALELARQTVLSGETVVWVEPDGPAVSAETSRRGGHDVDVRQWFERCGVEIAVAAEARAAQSLAGRWVLLARARHQAVDTVRRLTALGATVVSQPAIAIGPPADSEPLDAAIDRLEMYDWLVFSSANGVRFFVERLWDRSGDLRRLGRARLAAMGPGTAEALAEYRLLADVVPDEYRAEALAGALANSASAKRFLLVRASRGREALAEGLSAVGAIVEQVVAYDSTDVDPGRASLEPVRRLLDEGRIAWLVVSSSAIARSIDRLFGPRLKKTRLASISPITSDALRQLGHKPAIEAKEYTLEGIVQAMVQDP